MISASAPIQDLMLMRCKTVFNFLLGCIFVESGLCVCVCQDIVQTCSNTVLRSRLHNISFIADYGNVFEAGSNDAINLILVVQGPKNCQVKLT